LISERSSKRPEQNRFHIILERGQGVLGIIWREMASVESNDLDDAHCKPRQSRLKYVGTELALTHRLDNAFTTIWMAVFLLLV